MPSSAFAALAWTALAVAFTATAWTVFDIYSRGHRQQMLRQIGMTIGFFPSWR